MSEYNNAYMTGQPYHGTFNPERVGSGGPSAASPQALAGKRPRRLRSTQGAAHFGNGQKGKAGRGSNNNKIEYHDRRTAAPIFLQKTFEMINRCEKQHSHLAGWTEDGKMFVIKNQTVFAKEIIPQFFDHNKFTSFARQLNFYGFRKMQSRAIYKGDVNKETAKYVTFFNEKFQRERPDLLKEIQRSTKGGQSNSQNQEQQKEINALKEKVAQLEQTIQMMQNSHEERFAQIQSQLYQMASYMTPSHNGTSGEQQYNGNYNHGGDEANEETQYPSPEKIEPKSINYASAAKPTLEPHPNSKVLPDSRVLPAPPRQNSNMRYDSFLRGFSNASLSNESIPDISQFEQKLFQNMMTNPDPADNDSSNLQSPAASSGTKVDEGPLPQLNHNHAGITRQLSEGIQRLDLSLSEYPPLSSHGV